MTPYVRTRSGRLLAFISFLLCTWPATAPAQTPVQEGVRDFSFGSSPDRNPTGEKPESKLWFNDGIWWGSLFNSDDDEYQIYRFQPGSQSWQSTGTTIDARVTTKADAFWDAGTQHLYIVSHVFSSSGTAQSSSSSWGKLFRYSYSTGGKSYSLDAGFPVDVTRGRSETLTLAKDFAERLWVTYVEGSKVKINWSRGDDLTWGTPINLPVSSSAISTSSDDISAIVAFPNGDVGVIWSNQKTKSVYFSRHPAADDPDEWQSPETVLPGIGCSGACADDHINLKTDQTGRVFAILKTSLDTSGKPNQILAVRGTNGSWTLYTVDLGQQNQTRGVVQLDEDNGTVYVITADTGGGVVYMKSSPLDAIGFASGFGEPLIKSTADTSINDPTSMKQNVGSATGLLVLASDEGTRRYLHNFVPLGPPLPSPPSAPDDLEAAPVSSGQVHLTWHDESQNELAFELERSENGGPFAALVTLASNTTSYDDTAVSPLHTYRYRVRATNGLGPSAWSDPAEATVPGPPGTGNIRAITFEAGSITDEATGVDQKSGTVSIESSAPINGQYSARIDHKSSYLREQFDGTPDLYLSFFIRVDAMPSSDVHLLRILNGGSQVGTLLLRSNGRLRLRNNSSTVGSESGALHEGQVYRVGIHQRARGGGTNGILEAFLAEANDPFGDPLAALTNGTWTSESTEIRLGTITSVLVDMVLDDITLDDAMMPAGVSGPAPPSGLVANALTATSIELLWTDESDGETAFHVERAGSTGVFVEVATVAADVTTYTDLAVTPGTAYTYRVRAETSGLVGPYSATASATTPDVAPAAPADLAADAPTSGAVVLSWADHAGNETAFEIERAGADGVFAPLVTIGANATSHIDTSVLPETQYSYRVRAVNGVGPSDYSNTANVVTPLPSPPPDDDPPGAPASIKLMTFESGTITDPDTGADIVSGTVTFETSAPIKGARSAKIAGKAYLREDFDAADDLFVSFYLRLPATPADVRVALIMNGSTTVGNLFLSSGHLRLRSGSSTVGTTGFALAAGTVYRVLVHQRTSPSLLEAFVAEGDAPFGSPFASSTAAISGSATQVRIGGTNGSVNATLDDVALSDSSPAAPGDTPPDSTPPSPPAAPTDLSADSAGVVTLTWTDNSSSETAFLIERASGGAFAEIGSAPADSTSYIDSSVAAGTAYTYRVRATNDDGASAYSNEVEVTTPPAPEATAAIKLMTFESGTITDAGTGADSAHGTVTFETGDPIKGARSAAVDGSGYLQEDFDATADLYFSFYLRLPASPADVRIALVMNGSTTVGNLYLSSGRLRLRNGSSSLGDSAPLAVGRVYRVLLHQRTSPGLLEAFVAEGDVPFDAPFASSTASIAGSASRIRIGGTNGSVRAVFDDVRLDEAGAGD